MNRIDTGRAARPTNTESRGRSMTTELLDVQSASLVLELASQRQREGWSVFTCAVLVETSVTGLFGGSRSFDIGPLIQQVESLGWRLEVLNHVTVPRSETSFEVRAQMLFRQVSQST